MPFESLRFHNFRNLENAEIPVGKRQVFFIGPNGQGKTNFLEAVYLSCYGRSFRTTFDNHLQKFDQQEMSVSARFYYPHDINNISTIQVKIAQKKKSIFLDGKPIMDRKELVSRFPCIVFCHDDLEFVKGGPEFQRTFFDQSASLFSFSYLGVLQSYQKILKTRNLLIKQENYDLLGVYDEQLAGLGRELVAQRRMLVEKFNSLFIPLHQGISDIPEIVDIRYHSSWEGLEHEAVMRKLFERRSADINLKTTTSGPHRDKYRFFRGDQDFLPSASTGQLRLMSLLLRLAQAHLLNESLGKKGILLVDDVLLELDPEKRQKFMDRIPEFDQIFYTFLPGESMAENCGDDILKYSVLEGRFHEESR